MVHVCAILGVNMYLYSDETRQILEDFGQFDILKDFDKEKIVYDEIVKMAEKCKGFDGLTLKHTKYGRWAVITPDPYYLCRYTCFDEKGLISHGSYHNYIQAFNDAFQAGYQELCSPDTLDRVASNWNTR